MKNVCVRRTIWCPKGESREPTFDKLLSSHWRRSRLGIISDKLRHQRQKHVLAYFVKHTGSVARASGACWLPRLDILRTFSVELPRVRQSAYQSCLVQRSLELVCNNKSSLDAQHGSVTTHKFVREDCKAKLTLTKIVPSVH